MGQFTHVYAPPGLHELKKMVLNLLLTGCLWSRDKEVQLVENYLLGTNSVMIISAQPLHWRHNERDGVQNYIRLDCLHNRLFRRRSKKTSKLHVAQRDSNVENVFIWWRHHVWRFFHWVWIIRAKATVKWVPGSIIILTQYVEVTLLFDTKPSKIERRYNLEFYSIINFYDSIGRPGEHFNIQRCRVPRIGNRVFQDSKDHRRVPALPLFSCISLFSFIQICLCFFLYFHIKRCEFLFFLYFWKWLEQVPISLFFRTNVSLL